MGYREMINPRRRRRRRERERKEKALQSTLRV